MADAKMLDDGRRAAVAVSWGDPALTGSLDAGAFALPTGTVAFLLTDVAGSTRMWEAEADAMTLAMVRHDAILDLAISAHGGVRPMAQGEGDSIVAAFARASDAVLAARDAQRALGAEPWPTTTPLRVRMAVHTGEARFVDDTTYAGQAIIRTARLRAIAHGGQVLVSAAARDLTVDQLGDGVTMIDLGQHRLRDLARPEQVWQLAGSGLETDFEPLPSLDTLPHNLPVQLSSFIGRLEEIATLGRLVGSERLVTIVGAGGAGKTRLAQQVAAEVLDRFPDGVWWVELAEVTDPDVVAALVARAIGVKGDVGADAAESLAHVVADRQLLVVLDNCEHLVDACARLADRLLRAGAGLRVLATSREALDVPGEVAWRIPPLGLPDAADGPMPIGAISQHDGVRLFLDRAQRVRPNFHLDDDNAADVAAICQRLDGIPLALELAAARCRSLTPRQIHAGLADAFRLLTGGGRVSLARQATLEASISWSHDLLQPDEQVLLRRLSVFNGGCTLDDAEAVVADDSLPGTFVLDLLDRLVAQSLIQLDDSSATPRYRLLETVRQYGTRRLEAAGEGPALRDRHAERYGTRAAELQPTVVENVVDYIVLVRWFSEELDNLISAMEHLGATGAWSAAGRLGSRVMFALQFIDPPRAIAALQEVATHRDELDDRTLCEVLWSLGWAHTTMAQMPAALANLSTAAAVAEACGHLGVETHAKGAIGAIVAYADPAAGAPLLDEAVLLAKRSGSSQLEFIQVLYQLISAAVFLGDLSRAEELMEAADRLDADTGYNGATMHSIRGLARCFAGDFDAAEREVVSSVRFVEGAGAVSGRTDMARSNLTGAMTRLAEVLIALARGRRGPEVTELPRLIEVSRREGLLTSLPAFSLALGLACLVGDDVPGARLHLHESGEVSRSTGFTVVAAFAPAVEGLAALAEGDLAGAKALWTESDAINQRANLGYSDAWNRCLGAAIALTSDDLGAAREAGHDAFAFAVDRGFRAVVVHAIELLAATASAFGDSAEATQLSGMAARARDDLGYRMQLQGQRELLDAAMEAAQDELGAEAFGAAFEAGHQLDFDEMVAYVTRSRGERKRPTVGWESLTPTEWQVVDLVVEGRTNAEVAEELLMGRETVKTHLAHVYAKLGLRSRTELTARAKDRSADRNPDANAEVAGELVAQPRRGVDPASPSSSGLV